MPWRPLGTAAASRDVSSVISQQKFATNIQRPAFGQSQGSVKSFLGSSTGWWAAATLLPVKKEIARKTTETTQVLGQMNHPVHKHFPVQNIVAQRM